MNDIYNKGDKVCIGAGDLTFEGEVRAVIPMNRDNASNDQMLTHNYIVVTYNNGDVDTVARFHQRRSGHIVNSQRFTLKSESGA